MKTQFDDWLESDEAFESLHKDQRDAMRDAFTAGWSKGYEEAERVLDSREEAWNQRQPHPDSESISESLRFWIATRINKASVSMASSGYEDNELVKAFDSVCESIQQAMEQEK